jgi:AAA15 family ATPase/GTPase
MQLVKAEIQNFRSISKLEIEFKHGCQILVGINESGKSNILKALQLLDTSITPSPSDIRIERSAEEPIENAYVEFEFQLTSEEMELIYSIISSKFQTDSLKLPIIKGNGKFYTLKNFCLIRCLGVYSVNIKNGKRETDFWELPHNTFEVFPLWRKSILNNVTTIHINDEESLIIEPNQIFKISNDVNFNDSIHQAITAAEINEIIGSEVIKIIDQKLPKCVYWKYSDQYLLPSSISISAFAQSPDSCIPLKSMFELAGYNTNEKIVETITNGIQFPNRFINLLDRVSDATTKYLHATWNEHSKAKIKLRNNGDLLIPTIIDDQVSLDLINRSDGFKRFVSFLLMVSAKVKTSAIQNTLILVDEPEIGLHPKGAKSLMNELIKIGETNSVIYSTHSIFMIDRECIDRHAIIEKMDELTTLKRADKSRIQDEDVLYGAIGYSIFETLKEKNIIFEGWRDKKLFEVLACSTSKVNINLDVKLANIGLTFADGVKDVKNVAKFLELANRGCLIISDSDPVAVQHQKQYQHERGYGKWVLLNEIFKSTKYQTSEDLFTQETIISKANNFKSNYFKYSEFSELAIENFNNTNSTITALENWLKSNDLVAEKLKSALHELKNFLYENITRDELVPEADSLIDYVINYEF